MKKGLILFLACVFITGVVGADTQTTYEVVDGVGRITEIRTDVRDYSLEDLARAKTRCLSDIDNNNAQKASLDTRNTKLNAKIVKIDNLISQLVP